MSLSRKRVVVLAENIYEDLELWYPLLRLREEGAEVIVAGRQKGDVCESKHGYPVRVEESVEAIDPETVDAVVIPGGFAPDHMRRFRPFIEFVKRVSAHGGIVAFICHAGWVPISAGILEGKRATSYHSIEDDMRNAGALWEDSPVVRDGNLISSRTPQDLPDFCRTLIEALQ